MRIKNNTYKNIRVISFFLSFLHFGGFFWFMPYILEKPVCQIFFSLSPGFALLFLPLLSDIMLRWFLIRITAVLLGIAGIIYEIYNADSYLSLPPLQFADIADIAVTALAIALNIILFIAPIIVLAILIFRVINPKIVDNHSGMVSL